MAGDGQAGFPARITVLNGNRADKTPRRPSRRVSGKIRQEQTIGEGPPMLGMGGFRNSVGAAMLLGAIIFFAWNALEPFHGRLIIAQMAISLLAGQALGLGLLQLYHRLFDVKDV